MSKNPATISSDSSVDFAVKDVPLVSAAPKINDIILSPTDPSLPKIKLLSVVLEFSTTDTTTPLVTPTNPHKIHMFDDDNSSNAAHPTTDSSTIPNV